MTEQHITESFLTNLQQEKLDKLINNFENIFSTLNNEIGLFSDLEKEIHLTADKPIKCKPYQVSNQIVSSQNNKLKND